MSAVPTPTVELTDKLLLSVAETAAYIGLGEDTVRDLLLHDDPDTRLPAFTHGRRWCVVRAELDAWATAQLTRYQGDTNQ